jgi:hypothetical protein
MHFLQPNLTRPSVVLAYPIEFAPASGAGMGTACACTAVTGTRGETVAVTRGSAGGCLKGNQYTGIVPGDYTTCATNTPRTSTGGESSLMIYAEGARTNVALRSEAWENAVYTGDAGVTADTTAAPDNATTADTLSDATAGGIQSKCQVVVISTQTQYASSVFIRAGTLAKAGLRQYGIGNSAGDCSTTTTALASTYDRLECGSSAAYGAGLTAVVSCVDVGTTNADTGSVIVWGLQLETTGVNNGGASSYAATGAATAARSGDAVLMTIPSSTLSAGSMAVSAILFGNQFSNSGILGAHNATIGTFDTMFHGVPGPVYDLYVGATSKTASTSASAMRSLIRGSGFWGASTSLTVANTVTGTAKSPSNPFTRITIGYYVGGNVSNGLYGKVCLSDLTTGCQ